MEWCTGRRKRFISRLSPRRRQFDPLDLPSPAAPPLMEVSAAILDVTIPFPVDIVPL